MEVDGFAEGGSPAPKTLLHVEFINTLSVRQALSIFNKVFTVLYFTHYAIYTWDLNVITDASALVEIDRSSTSTYVLNVPAEGDLMLRVSGRALCNWLKTLEATMVLSITYVEGSSVVLFSATGGKSSMFVSQLEATAMDNEFDRRMEELDTIHQFIEKHDLGFDITPAYLSSSLRSMNRFLRLSVRRETSNTHHVDRLTFVSKDGSDVKRQWIEKSTPRHSNARSDSTLDKVDVPRFVPHISRSRGTKSEDFEFRIHGAVDPPGVSAEVTVQKLALKTAAEKFESVCTVRVTIRNGLYMVMTASTAVGSVTFVVKNCDTGVALAPYTVLRRANAPTRDTTNEYSTVNAPTEWSAPSLDLSPEEDVMFL